MDLHSIATIDAQGHHANRTTRARAATVRNNPYLRKKGAKSGGDLRRRPGMQSMIKRHTPLSLQADCRDWGGRCCRGDDRSRRIQHLADPNSSRATTLQDRTGSGTAQQHRRHETWRPGGQQIKVEA